MPPFLREGSFFHNLDLEDQDVFEVPEDSFKPDLVIDSHRDLLLLLRTVMYWGLSEVPVEVSSYLLRTGDVSDHAHLLDEFPDLTPYLKKILHAKSKNFNDGITDAIQQGLGVCVVRLMHRLDYVLSGECCEAAATVGDLESLMFLHTEGCPWDERTTTAAVLNNHCDCLQYALDFDCPRVPHLMQIAAEKGTTDTIRCLQNCNVPLTDDAFLPCLRGRKLDNLHYFVESGCTVPEDVCVLATMMSNRVCLEFLHQRGFSLTLLCTINASKGRLLMLLYLRESGCPWNASCCAKAAEGNHLDCLKYLHANGCPWGESTITAAIATGSWECLWYALRRGCSAHCILQLGLAGFVVVCYTHSILSNCCRGEWYKTRPMHIAIYLMASSNFLTMVIEKFSAYWTEYVNQQTATKFASRFSFVATVFSVVFFALSFLTPSE